MKPVIKKEKGKAPAKSKGQKKGSKSAPAPELTAEVMSVESEMMSEEKENHNSNNNNSSCISAVQTAPIVDDVVKAELNVASVKAGKQHVSHVMRKLVFGIFDQVRHKQGRTATEDVFRK